MAKSWLPAAPVYRLTCCGHLPEAGHSVVVVDNLATGKRENVNPAAAFYEVDIRNELGEVL